MPKQAYEQYMDGEYAGQIFGMATSSSVISSRQVAAATAVGVAGKISPTGVFSVGHTAGVVDGITLRQQTQEAQDRPAKVDGKIVYPAGHVAAIAEKCLVVVEYTGTVPTTKEVFINDTTGAFASVAGTGFTKAVNVTVFRQLPPKLAGGKARLVVEIV